MELETAIKEVAIEECLRLRSLNAELVEACKIALKVGTAYPEGSSARMDSHTEEVLISVLSKAKSIAEAEP